MKYCHTKNDIPKEKHYAIITFGSISIPGDERSRTNPGHGYPEHSQSTCDYVAYEDRDEWETEVSRLTLAKWATDFAALVVEPATVKMTVKVENGI